MQKSLSILSAVVIVLTLSFAEAALSQVAEVKPHPCKVAWSDEEVMCATYPVWENRETRQGRKIGLNIVIVPAQGPDKQPDPVFEIAGGPGQAIVEVGEFAGLGGRNRDVVLVDQRGTGKSNPLHCDLYGDPVDFRRAAGDLYPADAVKECRDKLEKVADLSQYTTAAFVDDLDEVRQWLGYGKINLFGGSYGSRAAQVYWRRHPETVRSVVLTSVAPVDLFLPLRHAYAGQRALDLLLEECASQPECRATFPDTKADLKAVRERIEKGVTVTVTNTRTGEKQEVRPTWGLIAEGIRYSLYGPDGASLPLLLRNAARGDLAPLVQISIERRLDLSIGFEGRLYYGGLNFSVTCAEDLPYITEEMTRRETAGTYLGDYRVRQQKEVCEIWPRGKVPADIHEDVRSDVPVLLISGERDPATPPEMAEKASRYMTNRLHVVIPRGAHGGGGECRSRLEREFLDRGSVQGLEPACAVGESPQTRFTVPAPTGAVEAVEKKPYPCRVPGMDQDVLCASYPVWENRETKQGRKIGLNIIILPANEWEKEPDPIFEFGGGPGQGIAGNAPGFAGGPLNRKRDIVLVDQRGTGGSNPLHCEFYGEPLDLRLAVGDMFPIPAVEKCRERLEKVADLTQYTTAAFADDLNEVRQWLGYDKINLEGGSYGTRSAMVYLRRHPETVRSVILVGTTGLDVHLPVEHAAAGQRALDLLLAECASQPECRAAYPDPKAELKKVRERIEKGVTVTVTNPVSKEEQEVRPTWGLVAEGMRFLMYGEAAAELPLKIRQAAEGDLQPLIQMAIDRRLNIAQLQWGLNFSVSCAEDLPFITEEKIREKTAGTYLGDYRIRQQKAVCKVWPRAKIAADTHEPVRSDVPVLLISGERDPVTPPALAEQAARFMTNHLHVIVPRGSHGVPGDCMVKVLGDFLDRASVQGLDTSCTQTIYGPTQFTIAEVKPHPCRVPDVDGEVLCATYPVWENRETKKRKIGLNIVILPATGPDKQPDPVFELAGGPGQAAASIAQIWAGSPLRPKRDIVLVDQRGTGKSNPLDCHLYGEPFDLQRAAGDMFPVDVVRACREKLEKTSDLGQYTSEVFVDDLNEVRQWLGYDKINLSGGSYGTRPAQLYMRRYPESVRTVFLTGAAALNAHNPMDHAPAGQRALDILLAECTSQPECRAAYPDTRAELKAIRERIEKGVSVTVTNPVTNEKAEVRPTWGLVAEGIRSLLYGQAVPGLLRQIRKAAEGDLVPLVQMAIDRRLGIDQNIDWGLGFAVTCAEDLPFITDEMSREKTAGTFLGDYRIRQQKAACAAWTRGKISPGFHEPVRSDLPVLLISGERDPVVPPQLSEEAARFMTNRLHVVITRGSHIAGGECTANLIRNFVDRASVNGLDPSCAERIYGPTEFALP